MKFNKKLGILVLISMSIVISAFSMEGEQEFKPSEEKSSEGMTFKSPIKVTSIFGLKTPSPEDFEFRSPFGLKPATPDWFSKGQPEIERRIHVTPEMFFEAIQNNRIDSVNEFLASMTSSGTIASINAPIKTAGHPFYGFNPLLLAVIFGRDAIVKIILEHGADTDFSINAPGSFNHGLNALLLAVINGNESILKIILEYEPELDYVLNNLGYKFHGHNALHIAILNKNKNIVRILLEHGAYPYAPINNLTSIYHDFNAINLLAFEKIEEMFGNGSVSNLPQGVLSAVLSPDGQSGPAPLPLVKFSDGIQRIITSAQYLNHVKKHFKCDPKCYLIALIYIKRLLQYRHLDRDINICTDIITLDYKTFLAAMVVAVKWFDEACFKNKFYAKIGFMELKDLNEYEKSLLNTLHFSIFVSPEDLSNLCAELIEYGKKPLPGR